MRLIKVVFVVQGVLSSSLRVQDHFNKTKLRVVVLIGINISTVEILTATTLIIRFTDIINGIATDIRQTLTH